MARVPQVHELEANNAFIMETFAKKEKKGSGYGAVAGKKEIQQLEAKMADIRDQLAVATDEEQIAKLESLLKKLEAKKGALRAKLAKEEQKKLIKKKGKKG